MAAAKGLLPSSVEMVKESLQLAVKLILGNVFGPMTSLGFWLYEWEESLGYQLQV